jgi:hypothetical protein
MFVAVFRRAWSEPDESNSHPFSLCYILTLSSNPCPSISLTVSYLTLCLKMKWGLRIRLDLCYPSVPVHFSVHALIVRSPYCVCFLCSPCTEENLQINSFQNFLFNCTHEISYRHLPVLYGDCFPVCGRLRYRGVSLHPAAIEVVMCLVEYPRDRIFVLNADRYSAD